MPFLDTIFGRRKPTSATAESAISELEGQLRGLPGRIAKAQVKLKNLADLSDEEHAAAEADIASAGREEARLTAQIEQLRAAHAAAAKTEAAAALRARANAAQKRVDTEHMPLIERYEAKAREIVESADALQAIDLEVERTNWAIQRARREEPEGVHPAPVASSTHRFRMVPDVVEPDRTVIEERWEEVDPQTGFWSAVAVYTIRDGKRIPNNLGARLRKVERIIKGGTRKGRATPCPTHGLKLPGARLDAPSFWPKPN